MKKQLNITFINPNTEDEIVRALSTIVAYNLAEKDSNTVFDYNNCENSHDIEDKLEIKN